MDTSSLDELTYVGSPYRYERRRTREVYVGDIGVGGDNPIRIQSMLTSDTLDTEACVKETLGLVEAGCEIVRITAQTVRHAANLEKIKAALKDHGCGVPIVADIHFKPEAAMEAARWVEKVRVNPGNYADSKKFAVREYTDAQYTEEIERIRERFSPLVALCKERGVAMRIGTNHGSLSDRIMNRYGDTPLGMVESALEFARIAREMDYHDFIFSMKASNPKVMIEAYRLLVARLNAEGAGVTQASGETSAGADGPPPERWAWNYPLHLGVTEAGDGEDGRIKSAIGIGSLLADGIGDTIRVSLTEDAVEEVPVCHALLGAVERIQNSECRSPNLERLTYDPFDYARRPSREIEVQGIKLGGEQTIRVFTSRKKWDQVAQKLEAMGEFQPEIVLEESGVVGIDPRDDAAVAGVNGREEPVVVTVADGVEMPVIAAFRLLAAKVDARHPILLKDVLGKSRCGIPPQGAEESAAGSRRHERQDAAATPDFLETLLVAGTNIGSLLCDGVGDAVLVQGEEAPGQSLRLAYNVLQAAGARIFKTDYVACPSCGRTLFNLQTTTQTIRKATGHLKGVRIAIMGCIVNGPGEMADADFGYVGGAPGKINLYVGRTPVEFNIPEAEAVDRLIDLIREHGKWVDASATLPTREASAGEAAVPRA